MRDQCVDGAIILLADAVTREYARGCLAASHDHILSFPVPQDDRAAGGRPLSTIDAQFCARALLYPVP